MWCTRKNLPVGSHFFQSGLAAKELPEPAERAEQSGVYEGYKRRIFVRVAIQECAYQVCIKCALCCIDSATQLHITHLAQHTVSQFRTKQEQFWKNKSHIFRTPLHIFTPSSYFTHLESKSTLIRTDIRILLDIFVFLRENDSVGRHCLFRLAAHFFNMNKCVQKSSWASLYSVMLPWCAFVILSQVFVLLMFQEFTIIVIINHT